MQDYLTLLSGGYKTQIIGLIWWTKSQQQLFNENFLDNNDFSHMNDILITCTSDGNIQLWNPETCHLVSELKVISSDDNLYLGFVQFSVENCFMFINYFLLKVFKRNIVYYLINSRLPVY